jgi:hypothetical protein
MTTMIATVSPTGASAADHSLNTLCYADQREISEKITHAFSRLPRNISQSNQYSGGPKPATIHSKPVAPKMLFGSGI